jgi:cyclic-di-GMP-binding protein
MPSFDIVSKADLQEVRNAVDQARREITTRYDFRDSKSEIDIKELLITLTADDNMKLKAVQEILKLKLAKRNVSLKCVEFKDPQPAGGDMLRQEVLVKQGLNDDELKSINKAIKAQKIKVTSQIQGEQIRVSGKKRDDLQAVIAHLRSEMKDLELQFINFRD